MFCSNCGKEVPDNAYVCTGCGCLVGGAQPVASETEKSVAVGGKNTKLSVFTLLTVGAIALTLMFLVLSIAGMYMGYGYGYGGGGIWFDDGLLSASWVMSIILVLPAGIITLIFGLKEKQNAALKLIAIATFIVSIFVFGTVFGCAIYQL